jgi:hypothetical protein
VSLHVVLSLLSPVARPRNKSVLLLRTVTPFRRKQLVVVAESLAQNRKTASRRSFRNLEAGGDYQAAALFALRLRQRPKPAPPASTLPSSHTAAGSGVVVGPPGWS